MFSFTYKEIFNRSAFSRTWQDVAKRDKALRVVVVAGFLVAYGFGVLVAGEFPPKKEILAPILYIGRFDFLPIIAVFPIVFYVLTWVANDYRLVARSLIVVTAFIGEIGYVIAVLGYGPGSYVVRLGFFLYPVIVGMLAAAQILAIRSEHAAEQS